MANQLYSDFGAQAPDPARIWLHADPSTGELKQATMEQLTGCLHSDTALINANNSGADPQDMGTVTIPASFFDTVGRFVKVIMMGETLVTTGPPVHRLIVAGTDAGPLTLSATGQFRVEAWIQRISTTQLKLFQFNTRVLTNAGASGITTVTLNQGNDLTIISRITAAAVANRVFVLFLNAQAMAS